MDPRLKQRLDRAARQQDVHRNDLISQILAERLGCSAFGKVPRRKPGPKPQPVPA
jgi:hypothetical protein